MRSHYAVYLCDMRQPADVLKCKRSNRAAAWKIVVRLNRKLMAQHKERPRGAPLAYCVREKPGEETG